MEIIGISLDAIQSFLAYLVTATALTLVYVFVYIWVTPHAGLTQRKADAVLESKFAKIL